MQIELAYITPRRQRLKSAPAQALVDEYLKRTCRYSPAHAVAHDSEASLLANLEKLAGRTPAALILLDSRGENLSSEGIAERLRKLQDASTQQVVFAIGPADGWSAHAWSRAQVRLAFGAITLPHELALAVLAEQVYRAFTLLAGHPYHSGHS